MSASPPFRARDAAGVTVVADDAWDDTLHAMGCDDVYLRRGYHVASSHLEPAPATPVLLVVRHDEGSLALPLIVRHLPGRHGFDATSAYGYGGPWVTGAPDMLAVGKAIDTWAREHGVVATFLRFHPLLGNHRMSPAGADVVAMGSTVSWRIDGDHDLRAGMHSHHRRAANKADRAGVETRVRVGQHDLGPFRDLYEITMRRQHATAFYFFPDAYWDALARDAGGEIVMVEAIIGGDLVAALLCVAGGGALHYHLGGTTDAARAVGASNRCFLAAAEWGRSQGLTHMHLGGGVGGDESAPLFVFKHRFDPGSPPLPFHIAKWVHDPERYRDVAGTDSTEGFFPPWRAP